MPSLSSPLNITNTNIANSCIFLQYTKMIDFGQIIGFDWDDGNRGKSTDKHNVSPAEAEQVFSNTPLLLLHDSGHSAAEQRYHAYGKTHAGRRLQIAFTLRQHATLLRIISVRPMSAKERKRYAEET